jgi:GNAT superfamily N-acetyltransferase
MDLQWIRENPPAWDAGKAVLVGGAPRGIFDFGDRYRAGDLLPGDWWRVEQGGALAGYGWMDSTWGGDAEILLAVAPERQQSGVGTFILDRLEAEARARGFNYLYNSVRPTHPDGARLTRWLESRGFVRSGEGGLLRRPVRGPK